MKLTAQNFQSWDDFDLTIDGFTVIIGLSNLGKSALYRALKGIVRNEIKANHVKIGESAVSVKLVIDNHEIVATRKVKGAATYKVNGQDYSKLGGATPEVLKNLNLEPVMIGEVKLDPVFAGQFGGQFMLEESPSAINAILGAFSTTEKLETGKKAGNSRIAECNSQAKVLASEIQNTTHLLDRLAPLKQQAETYISTLEMQENECNRTEATGTTLTNLINSRNQLNSILNVHRYTEVSGTEPIESSLQLVQGLQLAIHSQSKLNGMVSAAESLPTLDTIQAQTNLQVVRNAQILSETNVSLAGALHFTDKVADLAGIWNEVATTFKEHKATKAVVESVGTEKLSEAPGRINKHQEEVDALLSEAIKSFKIGKAVYGLLAVTKDHAEKQLQYKEYVDAITSLEVKLSKSTYCSNCGMIQ